MNAETLKALRKSIVHWERNSIAETVHCASIGPGSCALCELFYRGKECEGCPVSSATGHKRCRESPYVLVDYCLREWDIDDTPENKLRFQSAAREEVNFLRALVPAGE